MEEVIGAVDGVDDPGPAAGPRNRSTLFTQDAVVGAAALELFQDIGLGRVVRGGHNIGDRGFALRLQAGHPHQQCQLTGFPDQRGCQLVIVQ
jgi:hypothetical protein